MATEIEERHIMLDIETLGNGSNAAIMSIGAVEFCAQTGETGKYIELVVDPEDAVKYGDMDISTVLWWMQQSNEARESTFFPPEEVPKRTLACALLALTGFISASECHGVWGNGATFDNVILHNAARACDIAPLWSFRLDRDMRTLKWLDESFGLEAPDPLVGGTAHNCLDDAMWQAKKVGAILTTLRGYLDEH